MPALSAADVSAGLPAAAAASALLGKAGAAALLVLLFLAVTSAASAELIAVSSVLTYDVYKVGVGFVRDVVSYARSMDPADGGLVGGRGTSTHMRLRHRP